MSSGSTLNILFYFKNSSYVRLLENVLSDANVKYVKYCFSEIENLKKDLPKINPDIIVAEYTSAQLGFDFVNTVNQFSTFTPIIFISKNFTKDERRQQIKLGASDVITTKNLERLILAVDLAKRTKDLRVEKDKTKAALEEKESIFRALAESTSAAIFIYQGENFVYFNNAGCELLGYSLDELLQMKFWEVIHPDFKDLVYSRGLARQRGEDVPTTYDFKIITKSGEEKWLNFSSKLISYEGKPAAIGTGIDITDRKKAELALVKESEHLLAVLQTLPDNLFIVNSEGNIAQAVVSKDFGFVNKDIPFVDKNISDFVNNKNAEEIKELISLALENDDVHEEKIVIGDKGKKYFIKIRISKFDANHVVILVSDVTEKEYLNNELFNSRLKLKALSEGTIDGIILHDNGKIIEVNDAITNLLGYTRDDLINNNAVKLLVSKPYKKIVIENMLKDVTGPYEIEAVDRDGRKLFVELKSKNVFLGNKLIRATSVKDITDRKKAEETIRKLSTAVEQAKVGILITDKDGVIEYVNKFFTTISGFSKSESVGQKSNILKSGYHSEEFYKILWDTILAGKTYEEEIFNKRKNGTLYWEYNVISPIINDEGNITGFVNIKQDVTDDKRIMSELIETKEKAERANKLKDEFLAQMSHEIRTPLNTISNFVQLFEFELQDKLPEDLQFGILSMKNAMNRLIRTIELIVHVSELQTGTYEYVEKIVDIEEIVNNVFLSLKPHADEKGIELKLINKLEEYKLLGDEFSVHQIILQLVDNAIKYTNEGKVEIRAYHDKEKNICLDVEDTGIGIKKEYLDNIFRTFSQEEQGYKRRFEGNGLGLALVKGYCNLNNADISVKSEKGLGSTFTVVFPKHENKD